MADLLIEIICEEIPARMQARAAADLERLITGKLGEAGLKHGAARHFVAPRRSSDRSSCRSARPST